MINVTSAFRDVLKSGNKQYQIAGTITLSDSTTIAVSNSNIIAGSLVWDDALCGDDSFGALGAAPIGSLTFSLDNRNNDYTDYDFYDAEVAMKIGLQTTLGLEQIFKGWYIIEDVDYTGASINIKAVDFMSKLDKVYTSSIVYPTTLGVIAQDICTTCGLILSSANFPNASYEVSAPVLADDTTFREVLSWVATLAGCFVRMNVQNRVEFGWFDTDTLADYDNIDYTATSFKPETAGIHYITSTFSQNVGVDYITITGVKIVIPNNGEEGDTTFQYGTDDYCLELSNSNGFITTDNAQAIVNYIGAVIVGMAFHKASIEHTSDPTIEIGDIAVVHDYKKNVNYPIVITRTSFGAFKRQSTVSAIEPPARHKSARSNATTKTVQALKESVDAERTAREVAQEQFARQLANAAGLYNTAITTEEVDEQGETVTSTIYYLHDKPVLQESSFVMKFSNVGISLANAYSTTLDGGRETESTFPWGLDYTGTAILNKIYAEGIDADYITTGRIQSRTEGGTYWDLDSGELRLSSTTKISDTADYQALDNELNTISSWVQIKTETIDGVEREYLELGSSDMSLKTKLENGKLAFIQDDVEVAYISDKRLYITDATFIESIQIGDFAFQPRSSGNLSFLKVR